MGGQGVRAKECGRACASVISQMWEDTASKQVNMGGFPMWEGIVLFLNVGGNCVQAREFPNVGGRGVRATQSRDGGELATQVTSLSHSNREEIYQQELMLSLFNLLMLIPSLACNCEKFLDLYFCAHFVTFFVFFLFSKC